MGKRSASKAGGSWRGRPRSLRVRREERLGIPGLVAAVRFLGAAPPSMAREEVEVGRPGLLAVGGAAVKIPSDRRARRRTPRSRVGFRGHVGRHACVSRSFGPPPIAHRSAGRRDASGGRRSSVPSGGRRAVVELPEAGPWPSGRAGSLVQARVRAVRRRRRREDQVPAVGPTGGAVDVERRWVTWTGSPPHGLAARRQTWEEPDGWRGSRGSCRPADQRGLVSFEFAAVSGSGRCRRFHPHQVLRPLLAAKSVVRSTKPPGRRGARAADGQPCMEWRSRR